MRSRPLATLSIVAGLVVTGVLAGPTGAASAKPAAPGTSRSAVSASGWRPSLPPVRTSFATEGTVGGVDADAATITVDKLGRGGLTTSATVAVNPAAVVTVNGLAVTLADVPTGARVKVAGTVTAGVPTATKVQATTTWTFRADGVVAAVDLDAATVTVTGYPAVAVDGAAVVTVDGVPATLADVPTGARVKVSGTVTNSVPTATTVRATTTWTFRLDSRVQAVDATTITLPGFAPIAVDPAAVVRLNRATVTLASLPVGAQVRVSGTVTNGTPEASRVEATVPVRWYRWRR